MTTVSASEAKSHFGVLVEKAQKGPVTIEKQGRPVAVVISFEDYQDQFGDAPSKEERKEALAFLKKWSQLPALDSSQKELGDDVRAQAIWEKYSRTP